ncbi:MAG: tRNA 4-thiouridine(8) synthase ThiI [Candidatus Pacebacteria bacterium]|nr:tRNA 4-thiouridine(8) synthase ThiI [Candidatus Paceibacterota bacterium]
MLYTKIIIHYDEITLKGGNRPFFERALLFNIKEFLENVEHGEIYRDGGKFLVSINKKTDLENIKKILKRIPGISNFHFAVSEEKDLEKIKKKVVEFLTSSDLDETKKTFKIEARRADKKFEYKSPEINAKVGEYVLENTKFIVDVHNPDLEIVVDIGIKECFIYFNKILGIGGLPTGTTGKLVSLLSGGIDSPVASYMMAKRGAKLIFVHFKNRTIGGANDGEEKIQNLAKILSKFQGKSKLYIIPFEEFQKEIIAKIPAKNRMIVYKRIMFQIAEKIARKEKARGIVTGDSLSQVASQTLENIEVIYNSANLPIFSPLIGMNKQEIINLAVKIETFEISIIPYQDCCSFLIAKHPETKAKLEEIEKQEANLEIDTIIDKTLSEIEYKIF